MGRFNTPPALEHAPCIAERSLQFGPEKMEPAEGIGYKMKRFPAGPLQFNVITQKKIHL
jgi:hypothetical protein